VIKNITILFLSSFFLAGCFAESMTLVQSGVGAYQGNVVKSSVSPVLSLSVKHSTGKFPLEHMIKRERKRITNKASEFEKKIIETTKKQIAFSKVKISPVKSSIENQVSKLSDNLSRAKTFAKENFKHRPRFSYKVR
tara:strand:+ start:34 stop:444 length:411 start_codon:yes stop_codon:yes gene_type:complete